MNAAVKTWNSTRRVPSWQMACMLVALSGVLLGGAGCASHQQQATSIEDRTSIERPVEPLNEEETLTDRIGQVGVVLLVVVVTVGAILLPIFLLTK